MKALNSPDYFFVERKAHGAYVAKPSPGRHTLDRCITLKLFAVKAGIAENSDQAHAAIKHGHISVNGKKIKNPKYPVGINDVIESIPSKKYYTVGINERGQVSISEAEKEGMHHHIYRVVGKYRASGSKLMLRLHDGSAVHAKGEAKVNDSVVLEHGQHSVSEILPLKVGAKCLVIDGVHVGTQGKVTELKPGNMHSGASAVIVHSKDQSFETLVKNILVIN
jgi:small subunit ribosomal protein S4e